MRDSRKDLPQVQKAKSGFKKATLVGVLALFFTFSFSSRALAQDYEDSPAASTFINTLKGTEVGTAVTTTDRPTNDESKIFFLYNEESGKFLNLGGYWGSHVVVSDVPRPFWIEEAGNGTYYITSKVVASDQTSVAKENNIGNGNYMGWATNNKTTDKDPLLSSYGVFASLPKPSSGDNSQFAWHFEKVDNSTSTTDNKIKYHIYLDLKDVNVPTVTKKEITDGDPTASTTATIKWEEPVTGKFYLEATSTQNVFGDYNQDAQNYPTDPDYSYMGQIFMYIGAEALQDTKPGDNSVWTLISLDEYNTLFNKTYKELAGGNSTLHSDQYKFRSAKINISYLLHDPDFQINNPELNQWKYRNAEEANVDIKDYLSVGFDGYLKKATENNSFSDTYTDEEGNSTTLTADQISNRARHMGVQVKEIIANNEKFGKVKGEIYQTIQITKPGLYTLSSNFFSTLANSKIFVRYNNCTTANASNGYMTWDYQYFYEQNTWPESEKFALYNAVIEISSLRGDANFFISPELLEKNDNSISVDCGIIVDHTGEGSTNSKPYISTFANENSAVTSNSDDNDYAWSVIDNFQLSFRGLEEIKARNAPATADLILDEDEEDLNYVDGVSDSFENLRLHRTFSTGNWNTIILPVGLTEEQYNEAFESKAGEKDGCKVAPLAELKNLTPSEIQFETVKTASAYKKDGVNDNTDYWLKPMTPYIIKANKANGGCTETYAGTYHYWDEYITNVEDEDKTTFKKVIGDENKPYFLINNIKMVEGIIPRELHSDNFAFLNHYAKKMWQFSDIKAKTNTILSDGTEAEKNCTYVVTTGSKTSSNKASIAAFGTLARNYTYTKSDGTTSTTKLPIAYRPSLKDSYTMSGGNLTYYSAGTAMKGFRCWFEYTANKTAGGTSSAKPMPTLLLDGVNMATGIDEIMANDEGISMINQYQKGIFSLGGQRISQDASSFDALPKGIYIVNGKKVIKD